MAFYGRDSAGKEAQSSTSTLRIITYLLNLCVVFPRALLIVL